MGIIILSSEALLSLFALILCQRLVRQFGYRRLNFLSLMLWALLVTESWDIYLFYIRVQPFDILFEVPTIVLTLMAPLAVLFLRNLLTELKGSNEALQHQLKFELMISDISARFISIETEQIDGEIIRALKAIGEFHDIDRCFLHFFDEHADFNRGSLEWCAPGIASNKNDQGKLEIPLSLWRRNKLLMGKPVYANNIEDLLFEAEEDKKLWRSQGIKSVMNVPVFSQNEIIGFLGLQSIKHHVKWPSESVMLLKVATEIFTNALTKQQAEREKNDMARRLREKQKMEAIGKLAGGIAHDFNNILAAVIGYARLIESDVDDDSDAYEDSKKIISACTRAKDIIAKIARMRSNGGSVMNSLSLNALADETIQMLKATCPPNIEIKAQLPKEACFIFAHASDIHQLVMNLGVNSIDAMREKGGTLTISVQEVVPAGVPREFSTTAPAKAYAKLIVADTGKGIPAELIERIFDPYVTTKQLGHGLGIGLTIVKSLVHDNKGYITVSSKLNRGTEFALYFPLREQAYRQVQSETAVLQPGALNILLVDDEEMILETNQRLLQQLGHSVVIARNGDEAMHALTATSKSFDIAILDYAMPGDDGVTLAKKLRDRLSNLPIILCSGYTESIDLDKAKASGIKNVLTKPIELEALTACLVQ